MNRPTLITMSTLVLTIVAYVALAQMTPVDASRLVMDASSTSLALETWRVQGR
ncbi:MAG: hypothetical protein KIT60_30665 [Burkholderiaceae bacterium]|nr:hypothetical protein [Burkholderiaceae bacterium]